tara:strand:+ start:218 stop:1426 length:1209 start_codon:yes stop_codon:yes gene_type:complete
MKYKIRKQYGKGNCLYKNNILHDDSSYSSEDCDIIDSKKSSKVDTRKKYKLMNELINIFLKFTNKYGNNGYGLWRNRYQIGYEYDTELQNDISELSKSLDKYNKEVEYSNKYVIISYMNESLELIPRFFELIYPEEYNKSDAGKDAYYLVIANLDLNSNGVVENKVVNLLEYAEIELKRETILRNELLQRYINVSEERLNPRVMLYLNAAGNRISEYEWAIEIIKKVYKSKREKESSNYKIGLATMLPDDISREIATYQYGGTSSSDDLLHTFIELGVNPSKKELLKFKEKYLNPYNNNVFAWNKYFIIRTNMESNEKSFPELLHSSFIHFLNNETIYFANILSSFNYNFNEKSVNSLGNKVNLIDYANTFISKIEESQNVSNNLKRDYKNRLEIILDANRL